MGRRHKVDEIHLQIDDVIPFVNEQHSGFVIQWSSDIGFGEYQIYKSNYSDNWRGDSEYMDRNDDKDFIKELMKLFIEKLIID